MRHGLIPVRGIGVQYRSELQSIPEETPGDGGGSLNELQLGRSISETHVTPTSHFFWWRRRQTRCCGSTRHAVDLSLEGKRCERGE